jgi:putative ABC transport system permease protein
VNGWKLSLRWLRRDLAAGELNVMAISLVVAVAAMSSVGFFTGRVQSALVGEADQLLAADLVVNGDLPIPKEFEAEAARLGLARGATATFPSMTQTAAQASAQAQGADGRVQLSTIKAVSSSYPLRGAVRLAEASDPTERGSPNPGHAWADSRLLGALGLKVGDPLQVGKVTLKISAVVAREPDSAMDLANFLPRLLMNDADLAATGLVQQGSRIRWRLLVAGERPAVEQFRDWVKEHRARGQRVEDVREARPEVRVTLERSERFLKLSALLSVFLAAAALGLAARRYVERHLDTVALLRTLCLSQDEILALFLRQYALLAAFAVGLGLALGFAVQLVLSTVLAGMFAAALPAPGLLPALQGALVGLVLLFGFGLPPLLRLRNVAPLRVLRRDQTPAGNSLVASALGGLALLGLLAWQAGEPRLAGLTTFGLVFTVGFASLAAWGLVWGVPKLPMPLGAGLRFGLRNVARRRGLSVAQVVALSLGMMALMLLTVVRGDLLSAWERQLPKDAPNRFVINIQPDQRAPIAAFFEKRGLQAPLVEPMVRGRLTAINGKPTKPLSGGLEDEQARRLSEREFNLSFAAEGIAKKEGSRLSAGTPLDDSKSEFSLEEGIAKTLKVKLGDVLTYDIAGSVREGRITSLRKVDWGSFRANFFVVGSRSMLGDQAASYITSFHLPEEQASAGDALAKEFPNLTVIDISTLLAEVQAVLAKALRAIEAVFAFSVLAGLVVLYAATLSTHDERRREAALLRTLGASGSVIRQAANAELLLLGGLSGLLAAAVALGLGVAAAHFLFDLPIAPSYWLLPAGLLFGAVAARVAAAPLLREVLETPPLRVLR